jgi:hypothetical protein
MSDWDRYSSEHDVRGTVYESDYRDSSSQQGFGGRARQGMDQMRHGAQEAGDRARQGFDHYFHQHPITFGIGALALGLAVGMLVPSTKPEERWLGDAADRMKERTRDTMHKFGDTAKSTFHEATEAARHGMEERGVDARSIKEGAQEAAKEAREAAEKTAEVERRASEGENK